MSYSSVDLEDFVDSYIEAALWSTNDESDESGGEPLDQNYDSSDIAEETEDEMVAVEARRQHVAALPCSSR